VADRNARRCSPGGRDNHGDSSLPLPQVSVIIPTRNRRKMLALTLRSVLWQQGVSFEVVVVDDASTDDSGTVVQSFADSRIRLVRHDTAGGVSRARNTGIAHARSDWLAFLDDDDLWAPDKLGLQLQAARESGLSWVYVGHVNVNLRHRVTGGAPPLPPDALIRRLHESNVVPGGCSGVMVAKHALEVAGKFDPQLQPLADWDLWLRLAQTGPPAWVPRPLVAYRVHGNQMSLDASRIQEEFQILAARYGEGNRAVLYRYLGWWALRVRSHRNALRFFIRGWLQRTSEYPLRVVAGDLASLGRDILEHRLRIRSARRPANGPSDEHYAWRAEGQAWVDGLIGSQNPEAVGSPGSNSPAEAARRR
jgi:glycosyltransferase involved in cell wall biosynthesis